MLGVIILIEDSEGKCFENWEENCNCNKNCNCWDKYFFNEKLMDIAIIINEYEEFSDRASFGCYESGGELHYEDPSQYIDIYNITTKKIEKKIKYNINKTIKEISFEKMEELIDSRKDVQN